VECELALQRLRAGGDPAAEAHLASCPTCFATLEEADPITHLLRAARPDPVTPGAQLPARILAAWRPQFVSFRVAAVAALLLSAAGVAAVGLAIGTLPGVVAGAVVFTADLLGTLSTVLAAMLALPRTLFLENPVRLIAFSALTVLACAVWIRLYQQAQPQRRVPIA